MIWTILSVKLVIFKISFKFDMDLDNVKSDLVTREFLAVLFAGFGNEYVNISLLISPTNSHLGSFHSPATTVMIPVQSASCQLSTNPSLNIL